MNIMTCRNCSHFEDNYLCELPRGICLNYDHFQWSTLIQISKNDLEEKYISRVAFEEMRDRAEKAEADIRVLKEALGSLRSEAHYQCEDCWYSCPKAEGGCCDDEVGNKCNCGTDRRNTIIDKALKKTGERVGEK